MQFYFLNICRLRFSCALNGERNANTGFFLMKRSVPDWKEQYKFVLLIDNIDHYLLTDV